MKVSRIKERAIITVCLVMVAVLGWASVVSDYCKGLPFCVYASEEKEEVNETVDSGSKKTKVNSNSNMNATPRFRSFRIDAHETVTMAAEKTIVDIPKIVSITDVNETVYATLNVNIRKKYDIQSESIGLLLGGEPITRTGVCDNGWSRVSYNDGEYYIHSDYLTTVKPLEETVDNYTDGWTYLGEFKITAYCGGSCCNGEWANQTSTGVSPREGRTIAVAPWVIPYGSEVKIDGLNNVYVAEDTGGFANRNSYQIDLFMDSHANTNSWGVQYRKVYIKN